MRVRLLDLPPPQRPIEHVVWRLTKDARIAEAVVRIYPHGRELRVTVGGVLFWSRLYRDGEDSRPLGEMATGCRQDFLRFGWRNIEDSERGCRHH